MIKSKKQSLIVISVFTLVMLLGEITYAFFNYTRTGAANRISVGDIYFTSSYDEVSLDGVFPIAKTTISTDNDNVMSIDVDIEGHTSYVNGLYYEVKASDVNLTVNGKNIPIGISVSSSNLDNVTLTNYEDGKVLTNGSLFASGRILASTGSVDNSVDGTITIKAYLDKDRIAISDTYNGLQTDLMGTTTGWVGGRVVLTTSEWNSLSSTPISFKVKVEAYENDVSTLVNGLMFNTKIKKLSGSITPEIEESIDHNIEQMLSQYSQEEIDEMLQEFGLTSIDDLRNSFGVEIPDSNITAIEKATEEPDVSLFTEDNIISTSDSVYPIYAWYDNGIIKYYSKTNNIKANTNMEGMFGILSSLTSIGALSNLDTTNVTNMSGLFTMDSSLIDISFLSNWNTSNVTNVARIFRGCTNLTNLNGLLNWNVLNVTNMNTMFYECSGLTNISGLLNWNTANLENMNEMFGYCAQLANVDGLINWNVSKVTNMAQMFSNCTSLINVNGLLNWDTSNVNDMNYLFMGCFALSDINGLRNFNVSKINNFASFFRECQITNLDALSNWNVSNADTMSFMFYGCTQLADTSGINDWDINSVGTNNFRQMFKNALSHPTFSKRVGTWDSNGTFTPSA